MHICTHIFPSCFNIPSPASIISISGNIIFAKYLCTKVLYQEVEFPKILPLHIYVYMTTLQLSGEALFLSSTIESYNYRVGKWPEDHLFQPLIGGTATVGCLVGTDKWQGLFSGGPLVVECPPLWGESSWNFISFQESLENIPVYPGIWVACQLCARCAHWLEESF